MFHVFGDETLLLHENAWCRGVCPFSVHEATDTSHQASLRLAASHLSAFVATRDHIIVVGTTSANINPSLDVVIRRNNFFLLKYSKYYGTTVALNNICAKTI
jgi:hypothetical protein